MYTQISETKMGQNVPVKDGETVRLLAQGGDGKVVFQAAGDDAPRSLPSHEFFGQYREAFPSEIATYDKQAEKAAKGPVRNQAEKD